MNRYRSHKVVEAVPIWSWIETETGWRIFAVGGGIIDGPPSLFARGEPKNLDYLVRYSDGYLSISPKAAFEEGYTEIGEPRGPLSDADVEKIAAVCHEANRGWCEANGDSTQPRWADAPDWQRSSAINGVRFHLANPNAPASASHDAWMAEKAASGWVWGPTKDANSKTHPCMVPFAHLPPEQQAKDRLFKATVHALAE